MEQISTRKLYSTLVSANKGNAQSQCHIGLHYFYSWGLPKNKTLALSWLQQSADNGYSMAHTLINDIKSLETEEVRI